MTYKYWVLTSIFTLIFGFRSHFLYAQPMCSGNENNNEKIPKISVEKRPAWFRYNPLDHTYVRFLEENGNWEGYGCFGKCEGGNPLDNTKSFTHSENKQIVKFMTTSKPCKWPDFAYLMFGVCHQLANRGLYYTNKIVKEADGYKLSSLIYKTFGWESIDQREYWMDRCLEASRQAGIWENGSPDEKTRNTQPIDPEFSLYAEFIGNIRSLKSEKKKNNEIEAYNDRLLRYYIDERIGRNKSKDYFPMLKEGHDSFARRKRELDKQLMAQGRITGEIIDKYNELINSYLLYAKENMQKNDFQALSGLKQDAEVDMRAFLPISLRE